MGRHSAVDGHDKVIGAVFFSRGSNAWLRCVGIGRQWPWHQIIATDEEIEAMRS